MLLAGPEATRNTIEHARQQQTRGQRFEIYKQTITACAVLKGCDIYGVLGDTHYPREPHKLRRYGNIYFGNESCIGEGQGVLAKPGQVAGGVKTGGFVREGCDVASNNVAGALGAVCIALGVEQSLMNQLLLKGSQALV